MKKNELIRTKSFVHARNNFNLNLPELSNKENEDLALTLKNFFAETLFNEKTSHVHYQLSRKLITFFSEKKNKPV